MIYLNAVIQLLSRFTTPDVVKQFKSGQLSKQPLLDAAADPINCLAQDKLFVGFLGRSKVEKLFKHGDISHGQRKKFYAAVLEFHKECFVYVVKNFPLFNDLIKHARAINIFNTSCSFKSVLYLVNHL